MNTSDYADPQPFFLVVDEQTGVVYLAHQEYAAANRALRSRLSDHDRIIDLALKANPQAREIKDRLRVASVHCTATTNFSRVLVDAKTGTLREREKSKAKAKATSAEAVSR